MAFFMLLLLVAIFWNTQGANLEKSAPFESRTIRPFPQMTDSEDDSTKMQVVVVLLVAFCVSLVITVIIRFLRKYSERQRLYSSFN